MRRYNPKEIEPRWQKVWEDSKLYQAGEDTAKPKKYVLEYFPYPSGAAMHVGHVRNYTIGDAIARFSRMRGYNVLYPMGWDAFGLPAENYAIKTGVSPREAINQNTGRFKQQLMQMGFSHDWSREIDSTDPNYYKWTQWFFLLLLKRGLAYQQESLQWWCPVDKTVLANEQVEAGKCWRCGSEVEKKALKQWFFKITDYADRLLKDLDDVNWSESIKSMQRNWIGKSTGAEVEFIVPNSATGDKQFNVSDSLKFTPELTNQVKAGHKTSTIRLEPKKLKVGDYAKMQTRHSGNRVTSFAIAKITRVETQTLKAIALNRPGHEVFESREEQLAAYRDYYGNEVTPETVFTVYDFEITADIITIFTTRPDTLFGATFMVLSPEHPLVAKITSGEQKNAIQNYVKQSLGKSEIERQETERDKTGVFTGAYAINPVNNQKIPVWVADYVLMGYGTGAIMAVPAHDERDYEFAKKFSLPITEVIEATTFDEENPPRPGKENTKRHVAICVIKNKQGKYLTLKWKKQDWHNFVMGGIEEGEELVKAAQREIAEETGYTDVKYIGRLPFGLNSIFYAAHKDVNRDIRVDVLLFELESDKQAALKWEKHEDFEFAWIDKSKLKDLRPVGGLEYITRWLEEGDYVYTGEGRVINSGAYSDMASEIVREKIVADLTKSKKGQEQVNYKIRDWLISRQRYWGAPIPVIHCPKDGVVPVPDDQLPVILPELKKFEPSGDGRSPLANVPDFVNTTCPKCGGKAERETDTMDGFACSSWYFLRFADPHNDQKAFDSDKAKFWLPVDDYIGGAEHAVMHLLYARFWTKVMFDERLVDFEEPFSTLRNQGMILAPDGAKMSKSKGNTIEPEGLIDQGYGADSIRIMELFIGPWNQTAAWSVEGMGGSFRFLQRFWTLVQEYRADESDDKPNEAVDKQLTSLTHRAIKKVSEDLEDLGFNTAIAALMESVNELYRLKAKHGFRPKSSWEAALNVFTQLLAPFAPHIAEELWHAELGHTESVHASTWPVHDEKLLAVDTITIAIQINGKLRATIEVDPQANKEAIIAAAKASERIIPQLAGKRLTKEIYVPGRLVSFVVA